MEVVLTDGSRGASITVEHETIELPAPRVPVRNAAGAGDAVAGAYLAGRLQGHRPAVALAWGVAAASLSVQREGCAASYPTAAEMHAFLERLTSDRRAAVPEAGA